MSESRFIQWRQSNPSGYDELLRRRRKKYASDEAARRRQLEHSAAWREKQRIRKSQKRVPRPKILLFDGREEECWSIGRTAEFLGVSKQTIANMETFGTIPTNHYVGRGGRRWWPASFVVWLKPFFLARFPSNLPGISAQELHRRVWTGWAEERVRRAIPIVALARVEELDDVPSEAPSE